MTLIIVGILIFGFLLIATEHVTNVNKAAVAIFVCTVGWVLYISYGSDFVMSQHAAEYAAFLDGREATSVTVKEFIASNIFLKYTGRACEIVLFLLATKTIVDILNNNECFDFITDMLRTRDSRKMLWMMGVVTLVISANLDNLTTTVMMLVVMRKLVPNRRQRMYYGAAIVMAANCGGAATVIGSPAGLMLWNTGKVSASHFFLTLMIPCLVAWIVPTWWISRKLPEHIESEVSYGAFRGDDNRLAVWQRVLLLCLGIGGLWFIPTFHNITKLSPYLGALCVLGVIWIVNEVFNRKQLDMEGMSERRVPTALFYGSHQLILFVMGIMLSLGVAWETGAVEQCWTFLQSVHVPDWGIGLGAGVVSTVLDNFATAASFISLNPQTAMNDGYWPLVAYMSAVGGNVLAVGSLSGVVLMRTEKVHAGWYFTHVGWMALVGVLAGFCLLLAIS